jgi:hypothetical protein
MKRETALQFAQNKAIREQRDVAVFERTPNHYYVIRPKELVETDEEPLETVRVEDISQDQADQILDEISNHKSLERGDRVVVGDDVEDIVRVTKILFETSSGARFLRSDGTGYGSGEDREVIYEVNQTWTN